MVRFLAFTVVAFLVPFILFGAWRFVTAGIVPGREAWSSVVWMRLAVIGAALMLGAILVLVSITGGHGNDVYRPAHLENGQLVPGSFD